MVLPSDIGDRVKWRLVPMDDEARCHRLVNDFIDENRGWILAHLGVYSDAQGRAILAIMRNPQFDAEQLLAQAKSRALAGPETAAIDLEQQTNAIVRQVRATKAAEAIVTGGVRPGVAQDVPRPGPRILPS